MPRLRRMEQRQRKRPRQRRHEKYTTAAIGGAMTFTEFCRLLSEQVDEVTLLELLDISSEDLVARFQDRIEERREYIEEDMEVIYVD